MHKLSTDDDWAKVELHRWQYGKLWAEGPLDIPKGLRAMAQALEDGCKPEFGSTMPSPLNVCEVLRFCARRFEIQDSNQMPQEQSDTARKE